jgi:translation elongation factor EF-1alpha
VRKIRKPKRKVAKRPARKAARKKVRKRVVKRAKVVKMPAKNLIGRISHYFGEIEVGVIELTGGLKIGDSISIEGATTNLTQRVESMQIDRMSVLEARPGDSVGIKVAGRVRDGDHVFLL